MRCETALLYFLGVFLVAVHGVASSEDADLPNEGGTELYLDGVDNFFVAFPTFQLSSDWTIESWIEPTAGRLTHPQCLLHLSTYSLVNLFTLELTYDGWRLQYGTEELIQYTNSLNDSSALNASHALIVNVTRQHHVAVTHRIVSSLQAELSLYVDGSPVASANLSRPEVGLPPLPFLAGACNVLVFDGFRRTKHFTGHMDEVRHWSTARSQSDIAAALNFTGPLSRWPAQLVTSSIEAQYTFDSMPDVEITDSSGNNAHGLRGSGGVSSELPRYQRSVFGNLRMGAAYHEFRAHPNATCPSANCLNLTGLLYSTEGVDYNAFLILSVPTNADGGIYITSAGNSTALSNNMLVTEGFFLVHTESAVPFDSFTLQLCTGLSTEVPQLGRCSGQPIHEVTFSVLDSRPPTAGQSIGLQLPGRDGFLELREPLAESGTVEFWAQFTHLDGEQTLFSVSEAQTGRSVLSLGLVDGQFTFHFCTAEPSFGGVQPFTLSLPELFNTEPQHLAISWEYLRSARGRAIYQVNLYRNCTPMTAEPLELRDACVNFGSDAASLRLPSFGQRYGSGRGGLEPASFASAHFDDIRVWRVAVPQQQLCAQHRAFLGGQESGLQAYFPITSADALRGNAVVENRAADGADADLRCTTFRLACPSIVRGRGYALRPSVFPLPPEPLILETSAGYVDDSRMLPPLEVHMPFYDIDNYVDYDLDARSYDGARIQIRSLPDASCGTLRLRGETQAMANASAQLLPEQLPLLFTPNRSGSMDLDRFACLTGVTYDVVDTLGLRSAFTAEVRIAVKTAGPQVQAVELSALGAGAGGLVVVRFDGPTTRPADWQGLFEVVNGSLGSGNLTGRWSTTGDALVLESQDASTGFGLTPDISRLRFFGVGGVEARTAGNDSYPCTGLSPAAQGSFQDPDCAGNFIFSAAEASCVSCGDGNFRSTDGLSCLPCVPGTFLPRGAPGLCQSCPAGKYLPAGAASRTECIPASPGYYVPREALVTQFSCPRGMITESSGSTTCFRCPEGADCEHPQHPGSLAVPQRSFFRTELGEIESCKLSAACRGWDLAARQNDCAEGMGGYLCQRCLGDWWRPYDQLYALCSRCGWSGPLGLIMIVLLATGCIWALAVLSIDAALWGNMHAVLVRSTLNYFTAATVLSHVQAWEWEAALGSSSSGVVAGFLSVLLRFNGGVPAHFMGLECLSGDGQWQIIKTQTWLWFLMPLIWMAAVTLMAVAIFQVYTWKVKLRRTIHQDVFKKDNFKKAASTKTFEFVQEHRFLGLFLTRAERCDFCDRIRLVLLDCIPLNIVTYFILLPPVLRMMVAPLACHRLGGGWRLLADAEVVCWEGEHTGWFVFALLGILLWGFIIPLLMFVYLWRKQDAIREDIHVRTPMIWLTDGYEPRYVYWEFVVHLRRVLITLVAAWPDLSRSSELAMYQGIGIAALLLHYSYQPFDNRAGELLDHVERNGLCAFLLLVTITQLVLQANPSGAEDLLPVLVACLLVSLSLLLPSGAGVELYVKLACMTLMVVLLILERVSDFDADQKRQVSFILVLFATIINLLFICWLVNHMCHQVLDAVSEALSRKKKAIGETTDSFFKKPKEAWEIAVSTQNMVGPALPESTFMPKPELPDPGHDWWSRMQHYIISSHSEAGKGLIRYDEETEELVLGLHLGTYMHDTTLSSYTRKQLAKLGPFISDEERRFVALSFRDALIHIIVDCNVKEVPCNLLEFLIRFAFRGCYKEMATRTVTQMSIWQNPGPHSESSDHADFRNMDFAEQLFDPKIFERGVTAEDFAAKLEHIVALPAHEVLHDLEGFQQVRKSLVRGAGAGRQ